MWEDEYAPALRESLAPVGRERREGVDLAVGRDEIVGRFAIAEGFVASLLVMILIDAVFVAAVAV